MSVVRLAVVFVCALLMFGGMASAQRRPPVQPAAAWELLGETNVGFGVDRDVISLGRAEDHFRNRSYGRLRIVAERGDVRIREIRVRYINGYTEDIRLERSLRGGESVVVDLPERRSFLSQIELVYQREGGIGGIIGRWNRPRIKVFGENRGGLGLPDRPRPDVVGDGRPPNWTKLGEAQVSARQDRDVIRISYDEEWYRTRGFDKLHFVSTGGDVQMRDIRITYINNYQETVRVDRGVRRGANLTVDLPGRRSYLKEIEMTYRARTPGGPRGQMSVYGEEATRR